MVSALPLPGEIVEVKHGVTHEPVETAAAKTFGTITLIILGIMMGTIVLLDAATIGKHIGRLQENVCGIKEAEADETKEAESSGGDAAVQDV